MDHISKIPDGMNFSNWPSSLGSLIHCDFLLLFFKIRGLTGSANKIGTLTCYEYGPEAKATDPVFFKERGQTTVQTASVVIYKM